MKVLLNTTTLRQGGALQTSSAFIMQALRHQSDIEWTFAVSRQLVCELGHFGVELPSGAHVFDKPPTYSMSSRRRLRALEAAIKPDCVFTFSGPAYVRFQRFHLLGCSAGWVTHSTWAALRSLGTVRDSAICVLRNLYKAYWFRSADAWVMQTNTAKVGMAKRLHVSADRISVIANTCGDLYFANQESRPFYSSRAPLRILCFAAGYKHKNLEILPDIALELAKRQPGLDFRIVTTLPPGSRLLLLVMARAAKLGVAGYFENRGAIPVAEGPALYRTCDLSLIPTLLETFSANYPEAMAMGLPIVTTEFDFARDVCQDAALYYSPRDASAAAEQICRLVGDQMLWERQIARGKEVVRQLPTPYERYQQYLSLLYSLVGSNRPQVEAISSAAP